MSMDLETALERLEAMRKACLDHRGTEQDGTPYVLECCVEAGLNAEALRLVLDAARSASVVDLTNAAVARAREMLNPHPFVYQAHPRGEDYTHCGVCGALESDPIHQKPEATP